MGTDWGSLRRLEPVSRHFGFDRGTPVDRFYIERFLLANSECIRGRVLEIGDDTYTRRFGMDRVVRGDVLHVHAGNPQATIVGDLATDSTIPSSVFDCVIATQTFQLIFDPAAALETIHRILKPGGVLLATVPGLTVVSHESDEWSKTWYWSFTSPTLRRLVASVFSPALCRFEAHGNPLAGVCVLEGLAVEDISVPELEGSDPEYPVLLTVRATKEPA